MNVENEVDWIHDHIKEFAQFPGHNAVIIKDRKVILHDINSEDVLRQAKERYGDPKFARNHEGTGILTLHFEDGTVLFFTGFTAF